MLHLRQVHGIGHDWTRGYRFGEASNPGPLVRAGTRSGGRTGPVLDTNSFAHHDCTVHQPQQQQSSCSFASAYTFVSPSMKLTANITRLFSKSTHRANPPVSSQGTMFDRPPALRSKSPSVHKSLRVGLAEVLRPNSAPQVHERPGYPSRETGECWSGHQPPCRNVGVQPPRRRHHLTFTWP